MSTTPPVVAPPAPTLTPDTGTPAWLTHVVAALLVIAPIVLTIVNPNGAFGGVAGPLVIAAGVLAAAAIHITKIVLENGFTRAGLVRSAEEIVAWGRENWSTFVTVFEAAKGVVVDVATHTSKLAALQAQVDALNQQVTTLVASQAAFRQAFAPPTSIASGAYAPPAAPTTTNP